MRGSGPLGPPRRGTSQAGDVLMGMLAWGGQRGSSLVLHLEEREEKKKGKMLAVVAWWSSLHCPPAVWVPPRTWVTLCFKQLLMVCKRWEGKVRSAALHRAQPQRHFWGLLQGSAASSHPLLQPPPGDLHIPSCRAGPCQQPQPVPLQLRPASAWVSACTRAEHLQKRSQTLENTALIKGKTCEKDVLQGQGQRQ